MDKEIANRIRGAILGAACANSLGGTCLGMNRKEIMFSVGIRGVRQYTPGLPKSLLPGYQPGALLTDTMLAMTVADSLVANKGNFVASDMRDRLTSLLASNEFLDGSPGAHCLLPLRALADNFSSNDGLSNADNTHVSMAARAFPIGCLPPGQDVVQIASEQAKLNHADSRVCAASAVIADSVNEFVRGRRLDTAEQVRDYVLKEFDIARKIDERFAESWDDVAPDLDYRNPAQAEDLPYSLINVDSHVNEAVPTAVGIFLIFRHDFEEAVASGASSGGDTDTVAAIVGALSGAYHGASAIPDRWLNEISHRDRLEKVADELIALWN